MRGGSRGTRRETQRTNPRCLSSKRIRRHVVGGALWQLGRCCETTLVFSQTLQAGKSLVFKTRHTPNTANNVSEVLVILNPAQAPFLTQGLRGSQLHCVV